MGLAIDWFNQIIQVTSPDTNVSMQVLHDFIEDQMASPEGLDHADIIQPEGKIEDPSNPGTYSQIIVVLNSPWQIQFWGGSGYSRIFGGKLVGGLSDQPIKATGTANDITVLESPVDGVTVASPSADLAALSAAVWQRVVEAGYSAEGLLKILASQAVGNAVVPSGAGSYSFDNLSGTDTRIEGAIAGGARTVTKRDGT